VEEGCAGEEEIKEKEKHGIKKRKKWKSRRRNRGKV
jgi:hypothetical protein